MERIPPSQLTETAIPPYAQKRIVHELRKLSAQSIFTSHSPYVLEEFSLDETVILSRSDDGVLSQAKIALPDSVKHKRYRQEFRTRFCEGLLSRRVIIAEGATEATFFPVATRRLAELNPATYASLDARSRPSRRRSSRTFLALRKFRTWHPVRQHALPTSIQRLGQLC